MDDKKLLHPAAVERSGQRPGAVLLMALLVMAAVTASTIGVATVITSTLTQSGTLDDYIVASVAADTGLERALGIVALDRQQRNIALGASPAAANSVLNHITTAAGTCSITCQSGDQAGLACGSDAFCRNAVIPLSVGRSSFQVASLQGPDPVVVSELAANVPHTFDIIASSQRFLHIQASCGPDPCDRILELGWTLTDRNGVTASNRKPLTSTEYETGQCIDLVFVNTDLGGDPVILTGTLLGYRVSLRAVGGTIDDVQAEVYSDSVCSTSPQPVAGRIKIDSVGRVNRSGRISQSTKNAFVLWQPPSTGVFNYVLFSEQSIIP